MLARNEVIKLQTFRDGTTAWRVEDSRSGRFITYQKQPSKQLPWKECTKLITDFSHCSENDILDIIITWYAENGLMIYQNEINWVVNYIRR